ncbi:glycosyltransferase [Microbacterium esteraromaticum]|uniref:glycosyltransferase n=1 Tax=Microbacterium esteraromaticum TaxID=57043 RepID=UPI0019568EE0|nr:glycosyltransferase [Microbacterium esteraromaticum]MBM7464634.1 glycosyltransferase involved in cell wall biosynthesis [Microbacterium esteraromaticum]
MGIQTAMDRITESASIVEAMRAGDDLAFEAGRDPGVRTLRVLSAALAGDDDLAAIAAVHALAEMNDEEAVRLLSSLLSSPRPYIVEHAAHALGRRPARPEAVGRLVRLVAEGGFGGMLAQHTLEKWSTGAAELLAVALESACTGTLSHEARARLVETLGLVRHPLAVRPLRAWATDASEPASVRHAAVAALGQRREPAAISALEGIVVEGGALGELARLALIDAEPPSTARGGVEGLTVGQLFLHTDVDSTLSAAGAGDNGGIATLLVRLGDALVTETSAVQRVLTLSRGTAAQAAPDLLQVAGGGIGHLYGHIPLDAPPVSSASAWPLRVSVRRGIRRLLRAAGRVDVLHLRMADVGSLAAADVARELGIPTVFTVAPDPHSVISALERAGTLTRKDFGQADLAEHYWFRTHLVQSLAASAAHSVFFPRPELEADMQTLLGIDMSSHPERHTVVAEGVDLAVVDRAVERARLVADGADPTGALAELAGLLDALPEARRGLPLLVTVGRMHRVKGTATLVRVWAEGPLADAANLLVIGGDLEHPSADEREQLDLIRAAIPPAQHASRGLLLPGHRSNDVAAEWLAAARFGVPGRSAADGVYVCASLKEEFGLAILEAMATGLLVVAPDSGGPATYVEDGESGFLTQTGDPVTLATAIGRALERASAGEQGPAGRGRALVAERFTIQAMAAKLAPVYESVASKEAELQRAAEELV